MYPLVAILIERAPEVRKTIQDCTASAFILGIMTPPVVAAMGLVSVQDELIATDLALKLPNGDLYAPLVAQCTNRLEWVHWQCTRCFYHADKESDVSDHARKEHHIRWYHTAARKVCAHEISQPLESIQERATALVSFVKKVLPPEFRLSMTSSNKFSWIDGSPEEIYYVQVYEGGIRISPNVVTECNSVPVCTICTGCHSGPCDKGYSPFWFWNEPAMTPISHEIHPWYRHTDVVIIRCSTSEFACVGVLLSTEVVVVDDVTHNYVMTQMAAGHCFYIDHNQQLTKIWKTDRYNLLVLTKAVSFEVDKVAQGLDHVVFSTLDREILLRYAQDIIKKINAVDHEHTEYIYYDTNLKGIVAGVTRPHYPCLVYERGYLDKFIQFDYIKGPNGGTFVCESSSSGPYITTLPSGFRPLF